MKQARKRATKTDLQAQRRGKQKKRNKKKVWNKEMKRAA